MLSIISRKQLVSALGTSISVTSSSLQEGLQVQTLVRKGEALCGCVQGSADGRGWLGLDTVFERRDLRRAMRCMNVVESVCHTSTYVLVQTYPSKWLSFVPSSTSHAQSINGAWGSCLGALVCGIEWMGGDTLPSVFENFSPEPRQFSC